MTASNIQPEGSHSTIEIVPVTSADMDRFIRVPFRVHADDPHFVPPLILERREAFSPKINPFFQHADTQFWLARRDGVDVGRISAQIDHLAPSVKNEGAGHFGMIAADNDPAIFDALFATAENWLRARGCRKVLGPFNLSINEETGLLVDGFDTKPMLLMGHDHAYVGTQIERLGYAKAKDVLAYLMDITQPLPDNVRRLVERPLKDELRVRPMNMKHYHDDIVTMTSIFNDAWSGNWGFVPFTDAEIDHMAKSLKPILDPKLVAFAELNGEAVGFGVALPNINAAIGDFNGKLLPFNWAKLLWRLKVRGISSGRVPLMGVKRSISGFGARLVPFLIIEAMRQQGLRKGMREIELSWILEDNLPMRQIIETLGGRAYKTYRIYEKSLA
ncbi:MAG: hypothetical protein JWR16_950 [Nevskia sp.]|nr:hypothetical protein [Nevskia sp.]